jgi:UDP-glucose-4-epimerase GalE
MTSGSSILVTGGAGYIGSHTVRALRAAGRDVVVLDTLELGRADAVIDAPLIVGDITDHDLVTAICEEHGVGQVVHFAAYKSVGESMEQPAKYWRNNVAGTVELIEACLAADVRDIVFSSSCSVYGTPEVVPVGETESIKPESVYAESKAMIERVLSWYEVTHGLRSVSLRYFNAAGASFDNRIGEDWTFSINLIPLAMKALLLGDRRLQVFGDDYDTPDGTCIRDYIHVDDLADAHLRALDHLAGGGSTTAVNVGTGVGSSVLEVIRATERVSGRAVPYDIVDRRAGDPVATFADPTFAETTLGWRARYGLDEIVETAYAWHRSQVDA